jgi:hypothetical protein
MRRAAAAGERIEGFPPDSSGIEEAVSVVRAATLPRRYRFEVDLLRS